MGGLDLTATLRPVLSRTCSHPLSRKGHCQRTFNRAIACGETRHRLRRDRQTDPVRRGPGFGLAPWSVLWPLASGLRRTWRYDPRSPEPVRRRLQQSGQPRGVAGGCTGTCFSGSCFFVFAGNGHFVEVRSPRDSTVATQVTPTGRRGRVVHCGGSDTGCGRAWPHYGSLVPGNGSCWDSEA